ncbi:MAG: TM2 domain-containing protein [Rhodobacteraceae bacterium]|nr:TM2 domain-containing protein [Paracoccaceae bacterium]
MDRLYYRDEIYALADSLDQKERQIFFTELSAEEKNPVVIFGLNIFLGGLGVDRFVVGDIGLGILKLITMGGLGAWVIVDCFLIGNRTRTLNLQYAYDIYTRICGHPPQPV